MKKLRNSIVWVFGPSAAGKETLINYLATKKAEPLLKKMDMANAEIVVCQESIDWVAQYKDDPKGPKRELLLSIVPKYAVGHNKAILIKGQTLDLDHNRVRRMKKKLPNCEHIIFVMTGDSKELFQRWKDNKSWYKEEDSLNDVKKEIIGHKEEVFRLSNEFRIITIDGRAGMNYAIT